MGIIKFKSAWDKECQTRWSDYMTYLNNKEITMTNETKEKIREFLKKIEELKPAGFNIVSPGSDAGYYLDEELALSELEKLLYLAVKEERARVLEKIVSIPIKNESGSDYEMAQLRYREKVISLINQDK